MILCLGTTPTMQRTMIFNRLTIDEVNRAAEVHETASGKGVNVARVITTLGEGALAVGFVGGPRGEDLLSRMTAENIRHDFVHTQPPTRLCTTLIDRAGGTITELVEESKPVSPGDWEAIRAKVSAHIPRTKLLTISGSLPPGGPPDFYRHCIQMAAEAGVLAILDAQGEPLRQALAAQPLLVKPNRAELAAAYNISIDSDDDLRRAMLRLIEDGAQWAVITMGERGAVATDGQQFFRLPPIELEVVNSIGSGDAFTAGLAVALVRGQSMPDALKLATASAAANALTLFSGYVRPTDIERLLPLASVEPQKLDGKRG